MSLEPQASVWERRRRAPGLGIDPRRELTRRLLARIVHGRLTVTTPGGERLVGGGEGEGEAVLHIHRWRALWRILSQSDIGFAEAVISGDCASPDLVALLRLFAHNVDALGMAATPAGPARWLARLGHLVRANTRRGSARNILAHYDLGNDFFAAWLDPSLLYSSAIFAEGDTLEAAQARKLARIVEGLQLTGAERVLEIGCGWGALAADLAPRVAALDAVTVSPAQADFARARLGAHANARVALKDYRDIGRGYDRVVSIEMCEAVGEAYLPLYFQTIARALKPGGRALIQAITIAEARFATYARNADFIQRHIFPGGFLPSPSLLTDTAARAGLRLVGAETFGDSYARTLQEWRRRFHGHWPDIAALGFDARFRRLWDYYLCYCEAGFAEGTIDVGLYAFAPA